MTRRAEDVFAPTDAYGAPRAVSQAEAQDWGMGVDRAVEAFKATGGLYFATRADADASTDYAESRVAWVAEDPTPANNGVIAFAPSTKLWRRIGPLPYGLVTAAVTGGTENAIDATTPILASEAPLIILPIAATNTASPVTVTFNGGDALTIKTASGDDVPIGGLLTSVLGRVVGMTFCLLMSTNDEAISITTANARTAVQAAEAATAKADEAAGHEESARTSATAAAESAEKAAAAAGGGILTFNMRSPTNGNINPESGDYTAAQVGAVPISRKIRVGTGLLLDGVAGSDAEPAEGDLSADRLLNLVSLSLDTWKTGTDTTEAPISPEKLAATAAALAGGALPKGVVEISASGNYSPSQGTKFIMTILRGGGGSGAGANGSSNGGAGGGEGALGISLFAVDATASYPVTIGAGGASRPSGNNGIAGGATSITVAGVTCSAGGGGGGTVSGSGGAGGSPSATCFLGYLGNNGSLTSYGISPWRQSGAYYGRGGGPSQAAGQSGSQVGGAGYAGHITIMEFGS